MKIPTVRNCGRDCWALSRWRREAWGGLTYPGTPGGAVMCAEEVLTHAAALALEACGRLRRVPDGRGQGFDRYLAWWEARDRNRLVLDGMQVEEVPCDELPFTNMCNHCVLQGTACYERTDVTCHADARDDGIDVVFRKVEGGANNNNQREND